MMMIVMMIVMMMILLIITGGEGPARPMTGIRGAGYPGTAGGARGATFDPMNQARQMTSSAGLERQLEETPEDKIKAMERKVNDLIEESCIAAGRGEQRVALDRAKGGVRNSNQYTLTKI